MKCRCLCAVLSSVHAEIFTWHVSFCLLLYVFCSLCHVHHGLSFPSLPKVPSFPLPNIQRMGPVSLCLRRCLWVGSCGVPPPRPPTSWPLTPGQGAHRCARGWTARSSSPKIMFVCTLLSPCPAWQSTTQVSRDECWCVLCCRELTRTHSLSQLLVLFLLD